MSTLQNARFGATAAHPGTDRLPGVFLDRWIRSPGRKRYTPEHIAHLAGSSKRLPSATDPEESLP